ncbi:peptidoglycan-binding domain-containing protein [Streptomyces sp. ID05-39B]|uniref:peptidoglycan-binding domain-containing protein n=1 Tax=Streptomyces sp. ID05-39B TaxID=3028664 RepID=UPI0029B6FE8F|nr:peptidoglycan-binding domain-containing protein [Streptomyces sp. ID05-39B]MDX3527085.1 peptidoglycan-binding domain-containing protein [Streptomyces sp. ID05-39B]
MPTADEPAKPHERPVLEPIRVLRPRNTDALAALFRELTELTGDPENAEGYESVPLPRPEARTRELPPVPPIPPVPPVRRPGGSGIRRGAVAAGTVLAAALVGFGCALLLPDGDRKSADRTLPAAPPTAAAPQAGPDGSGTLREGAAGPEVTDLQQRLRRIPNVYDDGATDGRYDPALTEAVARFQLWYGIRGDENGVYGDDTRRDLESRTG